MFEGHLHGTPNLTYRLAAIVWSELWYRIILPLPYALYFPVEASLLLAVWQLRGEGQ